jgi:uracil phosphoribosyltransferase
MLGVFYFCRLLDLLVKSLTATGGSAIKAVEVLKEHGVPEERIIFINLVRNHSAWFYITRRTIHPDAIV